MIVNDEFEKIDYSVMWSMKWYLIPLKKWNVQKDNGVEAKQKISKFTSLLGPHWN